MKIIRIIPVFAAVTLLSCVEEPAEEETQNPFEELTEVLEDLNDDLSEIDGVQEIYTITSGSAGDFNLGEAIPTSSDEFEVKEEIETFESEEGPYEETVYNVSAENEELLQLSPAYDYETGEYLDEIGEINIFSDRFQTAEGIGAGSSLNDFMETYSDYKIWYTYVSDMYVIETEDLDIQFIIDGEGYKGDYPEITGDMVELSKEDFEDDTKIISVRMYKI